MSDKVKVAVRVRPFNRRELDLGTKCVVDMTDDQTSLYHPSSGMKESRSFGSTPVSDPHDRSHKKTPKTFAFDHCFWSMEAGQPKYADQEKVFNCLGTDILQRAYEGYNACIFAYGQTGSGKSFTMMGTQSDKGIIPRLCNSLFTYIDENENKQELSFKVEVSYMEIYNEKVRDLLDPQGSKHTLKVREHNILGPYVDGLSTLAVSSFNDIDDLMSEGNKSRTVAATNMNSESSRSHAVFNIILTQTLTDTLTAVSGEKVSKMSLVDLAGSERAQKTGAVGDRLKEGSNINKSLTTLGLVISGLADMASGKSKGKFVPYRDSVLTWLLKDNLGGNSKTVMVATLSPSADNYEETLSTLRYADRAKRIVNHAVVNEDPNARIIRELREEVDMLKRMLNEAQATQGPADLQDRLQESEKLMNEMSKTWEEKLKDTEKIHLERHAALEKMGISVQTSGIKVEKSKYYLVNLNADPSLNELLVYYLKDHTLIGRQDAPVQQDIQLSGLGICPQHCVIDIEGTDVSITPLENARTCVNGRTITERQKVKHGDRILWGNNHFFRINCPKANSPSAETPDQSIDYDFAQAELMTQQLGDDPIQEAISAMEKQHVDDKAEALEQQRQVFERQMQMLRSQMMSPSTPSLPYPQFFDPFSPKGGGAGSMGFLGGGSGMVGTPSGSVMHPKYQQWAQEREKLFKQSLASLKVEVMKANKLVMEANVLAAEMGKQTDFSVTLQIPASNLSPNRKRGAFVSEPAIQVKRKGEAGSQIWSMEKFENKIIDMREMYQERKDKGLPMMVDPPSVARVYRRMTSSTSSATSAASNASECSSSYVDVGPPVKGDPFNESQEAHNLIGVANVFLEALFYEVQLDYHVPIISQQGEVAGRLHIEICRISGSLPDDDTHSISTTTSNATGMGEYDEEGGGDTSVAVGSQLVCRVCIKNARGLPPALSHFVFCQYSFWNEPEPTVVPPIVGPGDEVLQHKRESGMSFKFNHTNEFCVTVTEEFMEHCVDGALSIEVWGHRSTGFVPGTWDVDPVQAKSRSVMDRWSELTRKIELWVEIHELNELGEYMPVEVTNKTTEVMTGGVYQLRQGHSRRILAHVKPVQDSGTLPIICESISLISIGCVCARSRLQKGLDSYQEEDLNILRERWNEALDRRREYLDEQLQQIMNKSDKTDAVVERERSLIDQWVCLTEERNSVLVPPAGSSIPGAPADWTPPPGMEQHIPVIFLDLNADDMSTPNMKEPAGGNSILPKEHNAKFYTLPFVKNSEKDVLAMCSWDSSIHDSVHLNRVTPANERVYLILKCIVRLSHPAAMELVLRKRICINVYKRQSLTDKLKKRIGKSALTLAGYGEYLQDTCYGTAVTYEVVSNIPKAFEDIEDRETLAQMAASQNHDSHSSDGESYIEKYIKGVSAVESILTLDRLRQEVAIKELLTARGRPLRKSTSVPNIHNILTSPLGINDQVRSDSIHDLSAHAAGSVGSPSSELSSSPNTANTRRSADHKELRDSIGLPNKPTAPYNLGSVMLNDQGTTMTGVSPQPGKMVKPMKTVVEEQSVREAKPLLNEEDSDDDEFAKLKENDKASGSSPLKDVSSPSSDEFQAFESYQGPLPSVSSSSSAQSTVHATSTAATTTTAAAAANNTSNAQLPQNTSKTSLQGSGSVPHSDTADSLVDAPNAKSFTPSMASSGYGSQAVSSQTLSSEDNNSVRSLDDTPEIENKPSNNGEHASMEKRLSNTSLIDAEVPSNLGTPLQPLSPEESASSDNSAQTVTDAQPGEAVQTSASTATLQDAGDLETDARQTPHVELDPYNRTASMSVSSAEDSDVVHKDIGGGNVVDPYSENAMDELEALSEHADDCPASPRPTSIDLKDTNTPAPAAPASEAVNHFSDKDADSSTVDPLSVSSPAVVLSKQQTQQSKQQNSISNEPVDQVSDKFDTDSKRRQSWHEKRTTNMLDDSAGIGLPTRHNLSSGSGGMRKSVSIDTLKTSSSFKKVRNSERVGGKNTPVKATYRPMSMNLDTMGGATSSGSLNDEETNHSDNDDTMSVCSFGSRADLSRLGDTPVPSWIQPGEPVIVLSSHGAPQKNGVVHFVGLTEFAAGNWVGVALENPEGKNDGSVKGTRYFKCRPRHGIFVRHEKLIMDKKRRTSMGGNGGGSGLKSASPQGSTRRSTGNLAASAKSPPSANNSSFMSATNSSNAKHK